MRFNLNNVLHRGVISLIILSFFIIGGCDVEFGGGDSGGGGGGGNTEVETVQGTIIDIIPAQDLEGITVEITVDNGTPETDVTDAAGFFSIDGPIAGSPQIDFIDSNSNSLGKIGLSVYPTADLELGDITLSSGTVSFDGLAQVTFNGNVSTNNCTGNTGTLEVDAKNDQEKVTIIVQISESTDLVFNGDDITCEDILLGRNVEVQGDILSINTVDASRVQLN